MTGHPSTCYQPENTLFNTINMASKKSSTSQTGEHKPDLLALEIGQRISQARNGLGLSQQAVHTRSKMLDPDGIGLSRAALSLYETGTNKPGAREILLLCEVLSVSPNWLLFGSESPARSLQQTTLFLVGNELDIATRLAIAILVLNPTDRDSIANIVFSMLSSKIGDVKMAALMSAANWLQKGFHAQLIKSAGENSENLTLNQLIDKFFHEWSDGTYTNWGTLRPPATEDQFENNDFPPPRDLKSNS